MNNNVFSLLCEQRKEYLSGEYMSGLLSISRAAVWKRINALKEDGAEIESVTGKGYRMVKLPDVLKEEYLAPFLPGKVFFKEEVDSTNNWAKKLAETQEGEFLVLCESQTDGRGRRGRTWVSGSKENICATFIFRPKMLPENAAGLTLAAALGVCDGIEENLGLTPTIKWPNDLILGDKKVCGILTEMSADLDGIRYVAIGIGINTNGKEIPDFLKDKATSLSLATGREIGRIELLCAVAKAVEKRVRRVEEKGIAALIKEYEQKSAIFGKEVYVISGEEKRKGRCVGFDDTGALLFEYEGKTEEIRSGEVSIRGVDRYV